MGLFDFLKKKQTAQHPIENSAIQPIDDNARVTEVLINKLAQLGYQAEASPEYQMVLLDQGLEISTDIIDVPGIHHYLLQLRVLAVHPLFFPNGIDENLIGAGETMESKIDTALDNYLNSTFKPIMDGFLDGHDPEVDLLVKTNDNEVLWHPKLGDLMMQGQWEHQPDWNYLFELLRDKIPGQLTNDKFNWLKIYISKRADGTIIGECLFNNQPWPDGTEAITNTAELWQVKGEFMGLKQFIMFRRCDKYDPVPQV